MNLDQLRYVVVLAGELHFARSAQQLGVEPSRLSRQIRRLEDELGVPLFDRTTREVRLTEAGAVFAKEAQEVLAGTERAAHLAQQAGRGETGTLTLGFVGSAANTVLPPVLRRFRLRYPAVEVRLRELPSARQAEELLQGRLDAGLLHAPAAADGLAVGEVARQRLVAALPAAHPLAVLDPLPVARLAEEAFVLFPRSLGPALHGHIMGVTRAAGFEPRVVQEAVQMQTIVGLVAEGLGISIVPESAAGVVRRGGVVFRPLSPTPPAVTLQLAWRRGETSPVVRNLRTVALADGGG